MADKDFKVKNGLIAGSNNLTIGSDPVTIYSSSNNIGIDIANPSDKLTVNAASSGASGIFVKNALGGNSQISFQAFNSTGLEIGQISGGSGYVTLKDNQPLVFKVNNNEKMRIAANGFIGIACNSPTAILEVGGSIKVNGTLTATTISGTVSGTASYATAAGTATTATTATSLSGSAISYSSSAYAGNQTGVTNIPTWARRITVLLNDISRPNNSGNPQPFIQLGYDGNWIQNNYDSVGTFTTSSGWTGTGQFYQGISFALGFYYFKSSGIVTFERWGSSNVWVASGTWSCYEKAGAGTTAGRVDLGGSPTSYYNVRIGHIAGFDGMTGSFVCQWA